MHIIAKDQLTGVLETYSPWRIHKLAYHGKIKINFLHFFFKQNNTQSPVSWTHLVEGHILIYAQLCQEYIYYYLLYNKF